MPVKSPEILVPNLLGWRQWLANNHSKSTAIWLVVARQEGTIPKVIYKDALDEALCYGWIDSGGGPRDQDTRYVRFGPRKANSPWSRRNIGFIERLEREGRMAEPGKAAVARAKSDGYWDAAYSADHIPDDLSAAITSSADAQTTWDSMAKRDRYAILVRLGSLPIASEARNKKIKSVVERLEDQQTVAASETVTEAGVSNDEEILSKIPPRISRGTRSSRRLAEARSKEA
ncbi:MAG: hypothetical protein GOMPHAMPRED_007873 [Gomphillus americanus]|uniref:OmdA domain containing protein n=1 Tax=Gomphillus americanus TaxID=1940652 RepID=A0A8H3EXC0_9LECA|nr:MAG: hypothetical protein GOMPHAMPRED_007873 [Gomphillus americanus]